MQFQRSSTGKSRQMVYVPELNPRSFLFFFERGPSWSLRDYSVPNRVREVRPRQMGWSAETVMQKARFSFDAPTMDTRDLAFWHAYTLLGNLEMLDGDEPAPPDEPPQAPPPCRSTPPISEGYPILNRPAFDALPKANKSGDVDRMQMSPNSEDWVTWNLLNVLTTSRPSEWWDDIRNLALEANPSSSLSAGQDESATIEYWRRVSSPPAYEAASRKRMRDSGDPILVTRSADPNPVEGASEIDITIATERQLVFIEAKLGSDIQMGTTYDPARNQVVRNVNCLLEQAAGREASFWMIVRDANPERAYVQIIAAYRADPERLVRSLPHRDPQTLRRIARNLTILRWQDIWPLLPLDRLEGTDETSRVLRELQVRVGNAGAAVVNQM